MPCMSSTNEISGEENMRCDEEVLYVGSCQSQLATARRSVDTYSSGSQSRGKSFPPVRQAPIVFSEVRLLKSPLFIALRSGSLMPSPTFYSQLTSEVYDEQQLN